MLALFLDLHLDALQGLGLELELAELELGSTDLRGYSSSRNRGDTISCKRADNRRFIAAASKGVGSGGVGAG